MISVKVTFTKSTDSKWHVVELFRFKHSIFTTNTYLPIPFNKVRSSCNTKYSNPYQPVQYISERPNQPQLNAHLYVFKAYMILQNIIITWNTIFILIWSHTISVLLYSPHTHHTLPVLLTGLTTSGFLQVFQFSRLSLSCLCVRERDKWIDGEYEYIWCLLMHYKYGIMYPDLLRVEVTI